MPCYILHPLYSSDQSTNSCGFVFFCCFRSAYNTHFRSSTPTLLIFNLGATPCTCHHISVLAVRIHVQWCFCIVTSELCCPVLTWSLSKCKRTVCNWTLHCGNYSSHPGTLFSDLSMDMQVPLRPGPGAKYSASWLLSWRDRCPTVSPCVRRAGLQTAHSMPVT